ncbi:porin [Sphingomonas crocodyli]|uniref:Porin n=2 Tax=Sphingomonas crocodyli TaxID=1979270 RepID=A0A437MBN6_9SPHN|nr:porin [Sphingomonas crocodyli]
MIGAAAPAYADTTDDLLLRLKAKGILTEEEYQALAQRKAEEPTPAVATPAVASAPSSSWLDEMKVVRATDSGVGVQIGSVALKFSGSINGFYVHDKGDPATPANAVVGGLATVGPKSSSVRNGLLPGFLKVEATTNQGGWDVGAHFGIYPGINSVLTSGGANSGGTPQALATAGIDFRQTYLTFGKPNFGEVKIGRDIGMFGQEAILNDITLLSVGTAAGNSAPSNTSLGRIGLGYLYTDFQPQITYTSPKLGGFQVAIGAFQPLVTIGNNEVNKTPGFQGKVTYDFASGGFGGKVWLNGITQKHDGIGTSPSYTGRGFDVGSKLTFGTASLLGYYYNGSGIGTTGLFILSTDAAGRKRDSDGFYVQGTYGIGKLTIGASYGESHLDLAKGEVNPTLLDTNSSWVGQLRYGLTDWVTLVGEYVHTRSEAHNGNKASSDAIATGAILFF